MPSPFLPGLGQIYLRLLQPQQPCPIVHGGQRSAKSCSDLLSRSHRIVTLEDTVLRLCPFSSFHIHLQIIIAVSVLSFRVFWAYIPDTSPAYCPAMPPPASCLHSGSGTSYPRPVSPLASSCAPLAPLRACSTSSFCPDISSLSVSYLPYVSVIPIGFPFSVSITVSP